MDKWLLGFTSIAFYAMSASLLWGIEWNEWLGVLLLWPAMLLAQEGNKVREGRKP